MHVSVCQKLLEGVEGKCIAPDLWCHTFGSLDIVLHHKIRNQTSGPSIDQIKRIDFLSAMEFDLICRVSSVVLCVQGQTLLDCFWLEG